MLKRVKARKHHRRQQKMFLWKKRKEKKYQFHMLNQDNEFHLVKKVRKNESFPG